jgi:hypothetical protein
MIPPVTSRSRSRVGNPRHLGCKLLIDIVGQIPDLPTSRLERLQPEVDRGLGYCELDAARPSTGLNLWTLRPQSVSAT